jgi:hypothetical protein
LLGNTDTNYILLNGDYFIMTDMAEGDAHKKLQKIKNILNTLPSDYRHRHKLKLSNIQSILSELTSDMDIPILSNFAPTATSTFIPKQDSPLKLKKELPTAQLDVDSLLKTLKSDLIEDLKTSRVDLMKGTREDI